MAIDYNKALANARRLIRENGRDVTVRTFTASGDEWNPVQVPSDVVVKAVQTQFKAEEIDGTLIQASDKLYLVAGGADISLAKRLIDGADYEVVRVETVKPGPVVVLYKVQVRL
jgi:hypothetical protein